MTNVRYQVKIIFWKHESRFPESNVHTEPSDRTLLGTCIFLQEHFTDDSIAYLWVHDIARNANCILIENGIKLPIPKALTPSLPNGMIEINRKMFFSSQRLYP